MQIINPIFQELPVEKKNSASERLCFDLKASKGCTGKLENLRDDSEIRLKINVKAALTEKMRLRV